MTRRLLLCLAIATLFASVCVAKNKKGFPKVITNAKYVYITTYEGPDQTARRMTQGDMQAVNDLREALRTWGYYAETLQRDQADLIFLVRKGGTSTKLGGDIGGASGPDRGVGPTTMGTGTTAIGNMGPAEDMLEIYDAKVGTNTSPLWRELQMDGLEPPRMGLLQDLRKQVEESAKQP